MTWIKCSARLPEIDDDYLTYIMDNGCSYRMEVQRFYVKERILEGTYLDSKTHWELTSIDDNICLYWMPLPNPPNEEFERKGAQQNIDPEYVKMVGGISKDSLGKEDL
jgi:hypothetical protein